MKKTISLLLFLVMAFSLSVPTYAAEAPNTLDETPALTQEQKDTLNDWLVYDETIKQFSIKDGAEKVLSESDYVLLSDCITATNYNISRADFASGEVFVIAPEQEGKEISLYYTEGVTKIEFHWWGASIYISKTDIQYIGDGLNIAGIGALVPGMSIIFKGVSN